MKKKLLSIFLVFAVILSFATCGKSDKSSAAQTTYDMDDFGVLYTKTQKMFAKESASRMRFFDKLEKNCNDLADNFFDDEK